MNETKLTNMTCQWRAGRKGQFKLTMPSGPSVPQEVTNCVLREPTKEYSAANAWYQFPQSRQTHTECLRDHGDTLACSCLLQLSWHNLLRRRGKCLSQPKPSSGSRLQMVLLLCGEEWARLTHNSIGTKQAELWWWDSHCTGVEK